MKNEELKKIQDLFSKKRDLESSLDQYNVACDGYFEIKNIEVKARWTNNYGVQETVFKKIPHFNHHDIRRYFMQEKNRIMCELGEVNAKIESIKIHF